MAAVILVLYFSCLALIMLCNFVHVYLAVVAFFAKSPRQLALLPAENKEALFVTVQLPIYNEVCVVERLMEYVLAMDYPKDRWEVQVLDDSTDETSQIIEDYLLRLPEDVPVRHIRRKIRTGYKAGALAEGLAVARGDLIAIFDADFMPPRDFLRCTVPYFGVYDRLAFVQARWGHLNEEENLLTRGLSYLLDMQFDIEHVAYQAKGYQTYFCGTAGIWSRRCISEIGGWQAGTLAEDTDISIRAQLHGWKSIYLQNIMCFAEVPASVHTMCLQQWRWNKGRTQVAKKYLFSMLRAPFSAKKKVHGLMQLMVAWLYPFIFSVSVLSFPLLYVKRNYVEFRDFFQYSGLLFFVFLSWFLANYLVLHLAKKKKGASRRHVSSFLWMFLISTGLSWRNALAVLSGWLGVKGTFVRTPKKGAKRGLYAQKLTFISKLPYLFEAIWMVYFAGAISYGLYYGEYGMLLFHAFFGLGYAIICVRGMRGV